MLLLKIYAVYSLKYLLSILFSSKCCEYRVVKTQLCSSEALPDTGCKACNDPDSKGRDWGAQRLLLIYPLENSSSSMEEVTFKLRFEGWRGDSCNTRLERGLSGYKCLISDLRQVPGPLPCFRDKVVKLWVADTKKAFIQVWHYLALAVVAAV